MKKINKKIALALFVVFALLVFMSNYETSGDASAIVAQLSEKSCDQTGSLMVAAGVEVSSDVVTTTDADSANVAAGSGSETRSDKSTDSRTVKSAIAARKAPNPCEWVCPQDIATLHDAQKVVAALDYLGYRIPGGWMACDGPEWEPLQVAIDSFRARHGFADSTTWREMFATLQVAYRGEFDCQNAFEAASQSNQLQATVITDEGKEYLATDIRQDTCQGVGYWEIDSIANGVTYSSEHNPCGILTGSTHAETHTVYGLRQIATDALPASTSLQDSSESHFVSQKVSPTDLLKKVKKNKKKIVLFPVVEHPHHHFAF